MHRLAQVCIELSPTVLLYNICDLICTINDEIDRNAMKQMILEFWANFFSGVEHVSGSFLRLAHASFFTQSRFHQLAEYRILLEFHPDTRMPQPRDFR